MSYVESVPLPTEFQIDLNKTAGNAHSGHNVVFGDLGGVEVAVKPFCGADGRTLESRRNKAEHEFRMYKLVQKLGYSTLQPLEVLEEHGIAYLISAYTPNLVASTSFDLTRPLGDSKRGKSTTDVVTEVCQSIGELHKDEITHGDAKLRNFPFHRLTKEGPYVVDLEGAQKHKSSHTRGAEYFENAVRNDLRSISYNLGQNGLGALLPLADRKDIFEGIILDSYLAGVSNAHEIPRSTIDNALQSYINGVQKYIEVDHEIVY